MWGSKKAKVVMFGGVKVQKVDWGEDFKIELVDWGEEIRIQFTDIPAAAKYKVKVVKF